MELPQEITDSGVLTVTPDTDPELIIRAERYNERMRANRMFAQRHRLLGSAFLALNVIMPVVIGFIGIKAGGMFILNPRVEWLEAAVLILFAAAYVFFGLIMRNLIAVTAFSAPLIFMDLRCALMAGINVVLTVFYVKYGKILKNQPGYPMFRKIHIERNDGEKFENPLDKSERK